MSGNLDFGSNGRPSRDLDPMGMPDPIRALVRGSHEELGIILEPQHVTTCGLGTSSNPREVNSNLLFCVAPADLSLPDLPSVTRYADLVEASWEVGGKAVALRLPRNEDETSRAIDWLVGSTELTPQATLAGLGALGCLNNINNIFQRSPSRTPGRHHPVERPSDLVVEVDLRSRAAPTPGASLHAPPHQLHRHRGQRGVRHVVTAEIDRGPASLQRLDMA